MSRIGKSTETKKKKKKKKRLVVAKSWGQESEEGHLMDPGFLF